MSDSVEIMVGRIEGQLVGIGREIGEIKDVLKCKSEDCNTCRKEIDGKLDLVDAKVGKIETARKIKNQVETKVRTWKQDIFNRTNGVIITATTLAIFTLDHFGDILAFLRGIF